MKEGNTQVKTLSENVDEPMDIDQRQMLLCLNQEHDPERLICDVMNQKGYPNALAESRELVKLECLTKILRSTSRMAKRWLQCMDCIDVINDFICCEIL